MTEPGGLDGGHSAPDAGLESLYAAAFDRAPVAMVIVDDEARYVAVNAAACAALGRDRTILVGSPGRELAGVIKDGPPWTEFLAKQASRGEFASTLVDGSERVL